MHPARNAARGTHGPRGALHELPSVSARLLFSGSLKLLGWCADEYMTADAGAEKKVFDDGLR